MRMAIVGAGLMGHWHAHSIRKTGGQVVGVADVRREAAQALASRYPAAVAYIDVERMLEQGKPDVLHICTPLATHYALAAMALEAGIHVLVEKPLTSVAQESERLYRQAAEFGVLVCPVHQFVFQDGVRKAMEWLPTIGELVFMGGTFRSAGGQGLTGTNLDEIVADILPHPLSLLHIFLQEKLSEIDWNVTRPQHGELHALGEWNGVATAIAVSMNARPTLTTFEIAGTAGTIHLDLFHGYAFREPGHVSRVRKIVHPFDFAARQFTAASLNLAGRALRQESAYPGLRRLIGSFYQAIRGEAGPPIMAEASLDIARARERLCPEVLQAKP